MVLFRAFWWVPAAAAVGLTGCALLRPGPAPALPPDAARPLFLPRSVPAPEAFLDPVLGMDVRTYDAAWARLYRDRVLPLVRRGGAPDSVAAARALCLAAPAALTLEDYRRTAEFLHRGLTRGAVPAADREQVQRRVMAHDHAEYVFMALAAVAAESDDPASMRTIVRRARRLTALRQALAAEPDLGVEAVADAERRLGDVTRIEWSTLFADAVPLQRLADGWRCRTDGDDRGLVQDWFSAGLGTLQDPAIWPACTLERMTVGPAKDDDADATPAIEWYAFVLEWPTEWNQRTVFLNVAGSADACQVASQGARLEPERKLDHAFRILLHDGAGGSTPPLRRLVLRVDRRRAGPTGAILAAPWVSAVEPPPPGAAVAPAN